MKTLLLALTYVYVYAVLLSSGKKLWHTSLALELSLWIFQRRSWLGAWAPSRNVGDPALAWRSPWRTSPLGIACEWIESQAQKSISRLQFDCYAWQIFFNQVWRVRILIFFCPFCSRVRMVQGNPYISYRRGWAGPAHGIWRKTRMRYWEQMARKS